MRPIPSARHQHAAASRGVRRAFQADGVSRHELEADREALVQVHSSIPALDEGLVFLSCMFVCAELAACRLCPYFTFGYCCLQCFALGFGVQM